MFLIFSQGLNWLGALRLNARNRALGILLLFFPSLCFCKLWKNYKYNVKGTLSSVAAKFTSKAFQFLWILSRGNSFLTLPVLSDGATIGTAPEFGLIK